jgi:carboxymethylenebutenolidase
MEKWMHRDDITIPTADGLRMPAYFARPDGGEPRPGILLVHEIFGLTPEIRAVADRLAGRGYAALVPDLYHRNRARLLCVARTMVALYRGEGDAFGDLESARAWLAAEPAVDHERVGVMGFCMGGGFAVLLAARGRFGAAGVWYGKVPDEIDALRGTCPVVGSFGAKDRPFAGHGERLESFLGTLGVPHDVRVYPEVGHAFAFEAKASALVMGLSRLSGMTVVYDRDVAEDAWARVDRFFDEHLRGAASDSP